MERTYHIQWPNDQNKPRLRPLVLALHGRGGTGISFERNTSRNTLKKAAARLGVVVVYPEGFKKRWHDGRTEHLPPGKRVDDVAFFDQLIDHMVDNHHIDPKRVYVTGISNGAMMAIRVALSLSKKVTAVAPVTGLLSEAIRDLRLENPVAMMLINGTADPMIPFEGGYIGRSGDRGAVLSSQATIEFFYKVTGVKPGLGLIQFLTKCVRTKLP